MENKILILQWPLPIFSILLWEIEALGLVVTDESW